MNYPPPLARFNKLRNFFSKCTKTNNNNLSFSSNGERETWLDVLRGFTMLLVIYWHVSCFTFGYFEFETHSTFNIFFSSFRMPMFFFISGFIAYRGIHYWDSRTYFSKLNAKLKVQLIPTIVFFVVLMELFGDYWNWSFPGGYWFTLILFEIFLIYYTVSVASHYTLKWIRPVMIVCIIILAFMGRNLPNEYKWLNHIQFQSLSAPLLYFSFGLIIRKNWCLIQNFLQSKGVISILLLLALLFNLLVIPYIDNTSMFFLLFEIIYKFSLIIIFFNFFFTTKKYWEKDTRIGKVMKFVGRRTLDLYMIHYFFLNPPMHSIGQMLKDNENIVLEVIIVGISTIVVASLSLLTSAIIRTSPFLAKYLFGSKPQPS